MLRLLQLLIFGHVHKWVEDRQGAAYETATDKYPVAKVSFCHCEKCGKRKSFRMKF